MAGAPDQALFTAAGHGVVRAPSQLATITPEGDADVAFAPSAALDPVSGRAIVAYGLLAAPSALIAWRPAVG